MGSFSHICYLFSVGAICYHYLLIEMWFHSWAIACVHEFVNACCRDDAV